MKGISLILMGSNLGQREDIMNQAVNMMLDRCGELIGKSLIYETEPWGFTAEQNFLNQVVAIRTEMTPHNLLREFMSIEKELGRVRIGIGYQSRPIDLDILYYDDLIINDDELIIPHPRLQKRRFTLLPLNDVASDFVHPILKKTNKELLEECEDTSEVTLYKKKLL